MHFSAFFRNTNLGRPGSPSRQQFERAFDEAGALMPTSFRSNGTLLFEASSSAKASKVLRAAAHNLQAVCGLKEPGCFRSIAALRSLPIDRVYAGVDESCVYEFTVSFACGPLVVPPTVPCSNPRGDAEILWFNEGDALSLTRKVMSGPGSPNRLLEQLTGVPFTSRSRNTVQQLLARYV
jgi:hypothetical protein